MECILRFSKIANRTRKFLFLSYPLGFRWVSSALDHAITYINFRIFFYKIILLKIHSKVSKKNVSTLQENPLKCERLFQAFRYQIWKASEMICQSCVLWLNKKNARVEYEMRRRMKSYVFMKINQFVFFIFQHVASSFLCRPPTEFPRKTFNWKLITHYHFPVFLYSKADAHASSSSIFCVIQYWY